MGPSEPRQDEPEDLLVPERPAPPTGAGRQGGRRWTVEPVSGTSGQDHLAYEPMARMAESYATPAAALRGYARACRRARAYYGGLGYRRGLYPSARAVLVGVA